MFQKWLEEEDALPWEQNSSALARSFYLHVRAHVVALGTGEKLTT